MAEIPVPVGAIYRGGSGDALAALRAREEAEGTFAPSVFSPDTLVEKGLVRVAHKRVPEGKNKEPSADALSKGAKLPTADAGFNMYYERHGKGPRKVVYIMGLNNSCFGWLKQVEHFGADEQYSVLVLDNRGYGNTDTPAGPYSTSEMALDVLELCDHVGWREERQLNVVGVSMGGMIALEIAKAAPQRVASLSLISTTSGQGRGEKNILTSLPPLSGVQTVARILAGRILNLDSDQYRVERVCDMLFPAPWLAERDPNDSSRTRREALCELFKWRFAFTRRQTLAGAFAQLRAVATHRVSSAQLRQINERIPAMAILTGDEDNLVNPANSEFLHKHLPAAEYHVFKGAGHALPMQLPEEINAALASNFGRAAKATSS